AWEEAAATLQFEPPELDYELRLPAAALDATLLSTLDRLQPFGQACPRPRIRVDGLRPLRSRGFGKGHLEIEAVDAAGTGLRLLGWGWAERWPTGSETLDVLGYLERDDWKGGLRLQLSDARPAAEGARRE